MPYTYRKKNGDEILCDTWEELKPLLAFGTDDGAAGSPQEKAAHRAPPHSGRHTGPASDRALLKALVEAGPTGVSSSILQNNLAKRAKGLPGALKAWAVRTGVAGDGSKLEDLFVSARPGGARGWRLTDAAIATAKTVLEGGGGG